MIFPWINGQVEIVGVAGDENTGSLDSEVQPMVYFPYSQTLDGGWSTVVRMTGPVTGVIAAVRNEVRALDPEVVVSRVRTMEQVITDAPYTVMRHYPIHSRGLRHYGLNAAGFQPLSHAVQVRSKAAELLHRCCVAPRWHGYVMFCIPHIDTRRVWIQRWQCFPIWGSLASLVLPVLLRHRFTSSVDSDEARPGRSRFKKCLQRGLVR